MALQALGVKCTEDEVAEVMGVRPMRGATWEDALAAAQHYGCRGSLCVPATLPQIKEWTDAGDPVLIAWNPEGREWSHASVIFDVEEDQTVHVADPNIPDPEETVRIVPRKEFYGKWAEKWPRYLFRRPAMRISREITPEGRQVMAQSRQADMADRFRAMNTLRQHVDPNRLVKSLVAAMSDMQAESFFATLADLHHYPLTLGGQRAGMLEDAMRHMDADTIIDEMAREVSDDLAESVLGEVANEHRIMLGGSDVARGLLTLAEFEQRLDEGPNPRISTADFSRLIQAKYKKDEKMTVEDVAEDIEEGGNPAGAKKWLEEHAENRDNLTDKKSSSLAVRNLANALKAGNADLHTLVGAVKRVDIAEDLSYAMSDFRSAQMSTLGVLLESDVISRPEDIMSDIGIRREPAEMIFNALYRLGVGKSAKYEKGKKIPLEKVVKDLEDGGNPEAAKKWKKEHARNKDRFQGGEDEGMYALEDDYEGGYQEDLFGGRMARRQRLTERYPGGLPGVHRQASAQRITPRLLLQMFRDMETGDASSLASAIQGARGSRGVSEALDLANQILGGYGVEKIESEEAWDNYHGNAVALYVNTGDTYNPTLIYDTEEEEFYLTDWGSWVEDYEQRGGRVKAASWNEAQPETVEDWLTWEEE